MKKIFVLIFFLLVSENIFSREILYLGRSPKALMMGDAYTAIADDAYTLFYNPAALGRNKSLEIHLLNPNIGITDALDEVDRFQDFPSNDLDGIVERLAGFPVYVETGIVPTLKFGPFGFSLLALSKSSFVLRNNTHPLLEINHNYDRGFVAGYAFSMGDGAKVERIGNRVKKVTAGSRTSIGFAVKHINREGIAGIFDLTSPTFSSAISAGTITDVDSLREVAGGGTGDGWGIDAGVEHVISSEHMTIALGLSALDIGDTRFNADPGSGPVPIQEMNVNFGAALTQRFAFMDYTLSFDMHPLNEGLDFGRMTHFGLELSFPILNIYAGYNEGYLSWGTKFSLGLFEIMFGFYGIEVGSSFKEEEGARALFQFNLLNFSADL